MSPNNDLPSPMINVPVASDPDNNNDNSKDQSSNLVDGVSKVETVLTPSQGGTQQTGGAVSSFAPQIADDVDLIEKEWVMKAKEIVAKTKDNPNLQSSELSKFKADYLKKRFNKDIKTSDK